MLMTMGYSGLLAWMALWISAFVLCFKARHDSKAAALSSGLIAYFVQSFLNSATVLNLLFLTIEAVLLKTAISDKGSGDIMKKDTNS